MLTYEILIIAPLFFALVILRTKLFLRDILSIVFVVILIVITINHFVSYIGYSYITFSDYFHNIFILLDAIVLLYFLWQGIAKKHNLVIIFSLVQIVLYGFVLSLTPTITSNDILVDNISSVMYLIINIVGGIIIIFALKYIESEQFSRFKKNSFIAILFFFLAVMNFIVSTNNIEIFFLLFELTTLCSYILISYRADEISIKNGLQALWMNQIGGVAILIALIFSITHYETIYFDKLISNIDGTYLLPIVLLSIAAFVKGASIPFDKWLLGAMVAPTPVSAILHSATMVKIAPFLMLKLSLAMNDFVSITITLIGSFVFVTASALALSKDYFKEILGLSTIALLGLMMSLAVIGTQESITACLILIVFHAIAKAMLFLQAGILEKMMHLKYLDDINGLVNHSPLVVFFIIVGFASLTLPPFGGFIGKFMAIESISTMIVQNPIYTLSLVFVALGSVFLTLLYFKVVTKLFAYDVDKEPKQYIHISKFYTIPSFILVCFLFFGIYVSFGNGFLSIVEIIVPFLIIAIVPILFATLIFKKAHRVKEYSCGEKDNLKLSAYYFDIPDSYKKSITVIAIVSLVILIVGVI